VRVRVRPIRGSWAVTEELKMALKLLGGPGARNRSVEGVI
jgi:hypothetical protein